MRRFVLTAALIAAFALPANASDCVQTDGQPGVYINGLGSPDEQCLTADEYTAMVSVDALLDAGLIQSAADNGDGTTTISFGAGVSNTIVTDPLDRPVSANPELEPDAPTVGELLYPATATRLSAMVG